jgi:transcriptional regulator with XRE-family HTH domain
MNKIRKWRQAHCLTVEQLASAFGCNKSIISRMENGLAQPGHQLALRINRVTAIPLVELRPDIWGWKSKAARTA